MLESQKELERARVQLAGVLVVADGATAPDKTAKQGDYGWSPAYEKTLCLRRWFDDACMVTSQIMHECPDSKAASMCKAWQTGVKVEVAPAKPGDIAHVPVLAAWAIGERYRKSAVVVLSYDTESQHTHCASWGRTIDDKYGAAYIGEKCMVAIGADMNHLRESEDFRKQSLTDAHNSGVEEVVAMLRADLAWIRNNVERGPDDALAHDICKTLGDAGTDGFIEKQIERAEQLKK